MSWLIIGEPEIRDGQTKVLCICSECGLQKYNSYSAKHKKIESITHRGCGTNYRNDVLKDRKEKAYKLLGGKPL